MNNVKKDGGKKLHTDNQIYKKAYTKNNKTGEGFRTQNSRKIGGGPKFRKNPKVGGVQKLEIWVPQFMLTKKVGIIIPTPRNLCQVSVGVDQLLGSRLSKVTTMFLQHELCQNA